MATGDTNDMAARIRAVLPTSWFPASASNEPSATPVLDGVLTGLGAVWAAIYSVLSYTRLQTRIATATDVFLDLISADFFGSTLERRSGEDDAAFRARIQRNIFAPRATRAALSAALFELTGRLPRIFEPAYTHDTGGYGTPAQGGGGMAYGEVGGYGSLQLPFQCFITAFRPAVGGIAEVACYAAGEAMPWFAPGAVTSRGSIATYLDSTGTMRIAQPGEVRPLYSGTSLIGLLIESAATNLIPTSLSFAAGWATSGAMGAIAPSDSIPPILPSATVMQFAPSTTAAVGQWSLGSLPTNTGYCASVWVYLPAGFAATTCVLNVGSRGSANQAVVAADQSLTGRWQRVSVQFASQGGDCYSGFEVEGGNLPAYVCCWQFEAGDMASSYVPTASAATTRDADVLLNTLPAAGGYGIGAIELADLGMAAAQVSDAEIDQTIAGVLPAATIAWTQIAS